MEIYFFTLIIGLLLMMGMPKLITIASTVCALFCGLVVLTTPIGMSSSFGMLLLATGQLSILGILGFILIKLGLYDSF